MSNYLKHDSTPDCPACAGMKTFMGRIAEIVHGSHELTPGDRMTALISEVAVEAYALLEVNGALADLPSAYEAICKQVMGDFEQMSGGTFTRDLMRHVGRQLDSKGPGRAVPIGFTMPDNGKVH